MSQSELRVIDGFKSQEEAEAAAEEDLLAVLFGDDPVWGRHPTVRKATARYRRRQRERAARRARLRVVTGTDG